MTCPSELTLTMHADGALSEDAAAAADTHLDTCADCRARFDRLGAEAGIIAAALAHDDTVVAPAFRRPGAVIPLAAAAAWLVAGVTLVTAAPTLFDFSLPTPLAWLDPFEEGTVADVAVHIAMFLAQRGGAIMTSIRDTAATAVALAFAGWIIYALRQFRRGSLMLLSLACVTIVGLIPAPSQALEIRRNDSGNVLVAADETIDDTLIAVGENVQVDGDVEGDLIALGRRVSIRGRVGGQLVTAARTVTIDGEVGGSVLAMGETLDVSPTRIAHNLYGFGSTVDADERTHIEQNAVVFAQRANINGPVGRDVLGFGEEIELGNAIGGSVTAYAKRVTLLTSARVAGDMVAHVPQEESLNVSPGAQVNGKLTTDLPEAEEPRSDYSTGAFYVAQLLRYAAAFVAGLILLALVPGLRRVSLHGAGNALVAGGVGLVTLVAMPIIAVIAMITIIGIPLGLLGLVLWLAGVYFAKIVLAHFVGERVTEAAGSRPHFAVALAVGLLLVLTFVSVPFIGGVLNFVLTACGLGMLVLFIWDALRGDTDTYPADG